MKVINLLENKSLNKRLETCLTNWNPNYIDFILHIHSVFSLIVYGLTQFIMLHCWVPTRTHSFNLQLLKNQFYWVKLLISLIARLQRQWLYVVMVTAAINEVTVTHVTKVTWMQQSLHTSEWMPLKEVTTVWHLVNLPSLGHLWMVLLCFKDLSFNVKAPCLFLVWLNMLSERRRSTPRSKKGQFWTFSWPNPQISLKQAIQTSDSFSENVSITEK